MLGGVFLNWFGDEVELISIDFGIARANVKCNGLGIVQTIDEIFCLRGGKAVVEEPPLKR